MRQRRIIVSGPAMRAGVIGAYVARRCASSNCEVMVAAQDDPEAARPIVARPDCHRFHDEIGLDPRDLLQTGDATPAFAVEVPTDAGAVAIPFGPYGVASNGAEFHSYWLRSTSATKLEDYSPALALHRQGRTFGFERATQLSVPFGLNLSCASYAELLLKHARALGAAIDSETANSDADIVIDCAVPGDAVSQWNGREVTIPGQSRVPGVEWQLLYNAAKRFTALAAWPENCAPEQLEFNRLSLAESEHIADFEELLFASGPTATDRASLRRKIEVFSACARIPMQDYEVFALHEWLAVLLTRRVRPKRHDRLADALPRSQLDAWLEQIEAAVRKLGQKAAAA